jgi:fatty acid desaturase
MSEKHREPKYYHHLHKKRRMKKRVFYMLLTTIFCIGIAALISIGTSNIYAVTGKITVFVITGGLFVFVFFLIMYQTTFGRRH